MNLCMYKDSREPGCVHPLPCPLHGTHVEPVAVVLNDYEWLIERAADGAKVLTLQVRRPGLQWLASRMCLTENGEEGERATREFMLREAGLIPKELAAHVA